MNAARNDLMIPRTEYTCRCLSSMLCGLSIVTVGSSAAPPSAPSAPYAPPFNPPNQLTFGHHPFIQLMPAAPPWPSIPARGSLNYQRSQFHLDQFGQPSTLQMLLDVGLWKSRAQEWRGIRFTSPPIRHVPDTVWSCTVVLYNTISGASC